MANTSDVVNIREGSMLLHVAYEAIGVILICNAYLTISILQYTKVSESDSLTFDGFVSQVGGQLGLFMGASILSIVQAFTYCLFSFCRHGDPTNDRQISDDDARANEYYGMNTAWHSVLCETTVLRYRILF